MAIKQLNDLSVDGSATLVSGKLFLTANNYAIENVGGNYGVRNSSGNYGGNDGTSAYTTPQDFFHIPGNLRVGPKYATSDRDYIKLIPAGSTSTIEMPNENAYIHNNAGNIVLRTGASTDAVIVSGADTTFAGNVTIGDTGVNDTRSLTLQTNSEQNTVINLKEASANYGFSLVYNGTANDFIIKRHDNSATGVDVLTLNRDDNDATFAGNITISKTDPTITLIDSSGANTDPNGKIVFSELSGHENFDINYNGASDRLEFRGKIGNTDNTDLVLINRDLTNTLQVLGGATFADVINLSSNKSVAWPGGSIRAEGNTLKLVATTLIDLQQNTQVQGNVTITGDSASPHNDKVLSVNRGLDGNVALQVLNSGEVVTNANYFYATGPGTSMYVQNTAVFRGSIINDTSNAPVKIGDDLEVTGNVKYNGELQVFSGSTDIGQISNLSGALNIQGTSTRDVSLGSDTTPQAVFIEGSNGRVGIGETNPQAQLHIADSSNNTSGIRFTTENGGNNDAINMHFQGSQPYAPFYISRKQTGGAEIQLQFDGDIILNGSNGDNTGIGTTQPQQKLHVNGNILCGSSLYFDSGTSNSITGSGGALNFQTNSSDVMKLKFGGDVDIFNSLNVTDKVSVGGILQVKDQIDLYEDGSPSTVRGGIAIGNYGNYSLVTNFTNDVAFSFNNKILLSSTTQSSIQADLTGGFNSTEVCNFVMTDLTGTGNNYANLELKQMSVSSSGSSRTTNTAIKFANGGNGIKGTITFGNGGTSYNTTSDYRLKEDFKDFNGLDLVSEINVYDFKWKEGGRAYGVKAHELQEVNNDWATGEKDEVGEIKSEDGTHVEGMIHQQVDYSALVPVLIKAIQELEAKVKILENK